jgi:hypothetical protein
MANPKPGFNVKKYDRASTKSGNNYKKNSRLIESPAINPLQRSSLTLEKKRIPTQKFKPMGMTYGGSSKGKGITKVVYRKKA